MTGHIFVAPGDITHIGADAIAFSASSHLGGDGNLYSSFETNIPGFAAWYVANRRSRSLPVPLGETFWMPLGRDHFPAGVAVVVATGKSDEPDKPGIAVGRSVDRAVNELRALGRKGRLLIGLPAFRMGKGGDQRQRESSALAQIQAAREALQRHPDIDLVFLTYTTALYRIFLDARQQQGCSPAPSVQRFPALEQALRKGTCVLFAGAGLSRNAGLPDWNELMQRLAGDLNLDSLANIDPLDMAQWYREQFGRERLGEVVRDTFGGKGQPTLAHYLLLALPVRHIITTNYDDLLERTLSAMKRYPVPIIRQTDVAQTAGQAVYVVKLHGDASQAGEIVLARDDYEEFFEKRPAMSLLLEGLLLNHTFFFVGYSLRDVNFRQLHSRIARMLRDNRQAFAVSFEARGPQGQYLTRQWHEKQVQLIPVPGADGAAQTRQFLLFLDRLAEEVTLRTPPLALAADVDIGATLEPLRKLLAGVGDEVEALCARKKLDPPELRFVVELAEFLGAHGWRPKGRGMTLCALWQALADQAEDEELRRRLLIAALNCAEAFADVRQVRHRLGER